MGYFVIMILGLYIVSYDMPGYDILPGWWFGTFFIFPYIGNNYPNWLIFFRGVETTNQLRIFVVKNHEQYPWSRDFFSVQYIQRSWIFHYRTSVYDFCIYWTEKNIYIQLEFFLDWASLSSHIYRMTVVTWRLGTERAAVFRTVMINWLVVIILVNHGESMVNQWLMWWDING